MSPYYRLHLFDPDKPLYYDVGPEIYLDYFIRSGLTFSGAVETSLISTFDEVSRGTKGNLPHVRTDLKNY